MKNVKKEELSKGMKQYIIIGGIVLVLLGVAVGSLITWAVTKNNDTPETVVNTPVSDESEEEKIITTYKYEHEIYEGDKLVEACDTIMNRINAIKTSNTYLQVQVGANEYDTYVYNKNGECFAQSASGTFTAITKKDGNSVKLDLEAGTVIVEKDLDILALMQNVVTLAKNKTDGTALYNMILAEDNGTVEYRIDILGIEPFRQSYAMFSEELANSMVEAITTDMGEDWEPHFIYSFILSENDMSFCCYIVEDNEEFLNWISQGYLTLGDWELQSAWYETDTANLSFDVAYLMLQDVVTNLDLVVRQYALDNGLITQEEIDKIEAELEAEANSSTEETSTETTETSTETDEVPDDGITSEPAEKTE